MEDADDGAEAAPAAEAQQETLAAPQGDAGEEVIFPRDTVLTVVDTINIAVAPEACLRLSAVPL